MAGAALVVLGGLWAQAARRHGRRRRSGDWQPGMRPQAWTSQARCPTCDRVGGVVTEAHGAAGPSRQGEGRHPPQPLLRFACLSCGHEHDRRTPG
ncbi:MAG: hypothetical protein ACQETV_06750 [Actinomycetota bacterium]